MVQDVCAQALRVEGTDAERRHTHTPENRMSFQYHEPTSLTEAGRLGAIYGAEGCFLAGGTDLIIQMRRGKLSPRHVISLHRVPGLDRVDVNGRVTLGALVTHRALERHPAFQ